MKLSRKKCSAEVPNVAMGDIAFNLLIFFVILARAQDDSHLQWQPANAENIKQARPAVVSIVIDTDGRTYLNGQPAAHAGLASAIERMLGQRGVGDRTVLLKVHRTTRAEMFEPVIEAISEAGGELVHVLEKEQTR